MKEKYSNSHFNNFRLFCTQNMYNRATGKTVHSPNHEVKEIHWGESIGGCYYCHKH